MKHNNHLSLDQIKIFLHNIQSNSNKCNKNIIDHISNCPLCRSCIENVKISLPNLEN